VPPEARRHVQSGRHRVARREGRSTSQGVQVEASVRAVRTPTMDDLDRAWELVQRHLSPTPLVSTPAVDGGLLKLESWQPTGSFKVRGALAALSALGAEARTTGVVAASAGNHGLGVAYAATLLGIRATIVVPETASAAKVAVLRRFTVDVVLHGDSYDAAEAYAVQHASDGPAFVSPYNDPAVIAGQSTIGPEVAAQVDGPMTIVAPIGGGGLVAGLSLWATGHPGVRVVGVEADASRAVSAAITRGAIVPVAIEPTLADGLAGNLETGSVTPEIIGKYAYALTSVSEPEIRAAMRFLAAEHGLVVEGSGAVAVAAVRAGKVDASGPLVAAVTGRNIALPTFAGVLSESGS
jgi:threonine dehydratase